MSTTFRILARSLGESRRLGGSSDVGIIIGIAGTLCCRQPFDCNRDFDMYGGIIVWILVMLYMFKALGVICDEYFVPSLEVIVDKLQLSNDVAGATFMAAGSSAPEFFTSTVATFLIVNEGGVGTIVGSAIFNILVICGATGYIACKDQALKIWWYPLCRDCFFYSLSILEMFIFIYDEEVKWYEGLIMFFTYVSYCVYMKFNPAIIIALGLTVPEDACDEVSIVDETISVVEPATEFSENGAELKMNGTTSIATEQTELRRLASGEAAKEDVRQPDVRGEQPNTPGTVSIDDKDSVEPVKSDDAGAKDSVKLNMAAKNSFDGVNSPTTHTASMLSTNLDPNDLEKKSPRERRRPSWGYAETKRDEEKRRPSKEGSPQKVLPLNGQGSLAQDTDADEKNVEEVTQTLTDEDEEEELTGWRKYARDPLLVLWELVMPDASRGHGMPLFFASIFFIGVCTFLMVDATHRTGQILNIPTLAMALVFLAAGTSIPDMLGSIAVAKQGEGDMAVANALGSNVFDILIGLGVPWFIKTGPMQEEVKFEGKFKELVWDIGALVVVLVLFVGVLAFQNWNLTRRVGIMLLFLYGVFLLWQVCAVWAFDPPLKENLEECTY